MLTRPWRFISKRSMNSANRSRKSKVKRPMRHHGVQRFRLCTTDSHCQSRPTGFTRNSPPGGPISFGSPISPEWPTGEWPYVDAALDLFTRKIVGWAMRDHMRVELTTAAVTMAIQRQVPREHQSDRGATLSWIFRHVDLLTNTNIHQTVSH
jgi:putative transposase